MQQYGLTLDGNKQRIFMEDQDDQQTEKKKLSNKLIEKTLISTFKNQVDDLTQYFFKYSKNPFLSQEVFVEIMKTLIAYIFLQFIVHKIFVYLFSEIIIYLRILCYMRIICYNVPIPVFDCFRDFPIF
jgi:hypothetical protein